MDNGLRLSVLFGRAVVPIADGEESGELPGYRWETDAELRDRVRAGLERDYG